MLAFRLCKKKDRRICRIPTSEQSRKTYEVNDINLAGQILDKISAEVAVCGGSTPYLSLTQDSGIGKVHVSAF